MASISIVQEGEDPGLNRDLLAGSSTPVMCSLFVLSGSGNISVCTKGEREYEWG